MQPISKEEREHTSNDGEDETVHFLDRLAVRTALRSENFARTIRFRTSLGVYETRMSATAVMFSLNRSQRGRNTRLLPHRIQLVNR